MMQRNKPTDLIIGSGKVHSIREFTNEVFRLLNLNKKNLITGDKKYKRNIDIRGYKADIRLTKKILKWAPKLNLKQIIFKMVKNELF